MWTMVIGGMASAVPPFLLPIGVSFLDRCIVIGISKRTTQAIGRKEQP